MNYYIYIYISNDNLFLKKIHNLLSINKALSHGSKIAGLGMSVVPKLILSRKPLFSKALQFKQSTLAQNLLAYS